MAPDRDSVKNIHVFRINRTVRKNQLPNNAGSDSSSPSINSRTSLSAETKRLICEDHINNPQYTQETLASKYGCQRTTIAKVKKQIKK